jgi:ribosome biogenesis GTPase
MKAENAVGLPARVTAVHKERYELICEKGLTYGKLKPSVYFTDEAMLFPTTGDFVLISYNDCGDSMIIKTLPRKTFFTRKDPNPNRGEQAVAANFDTVFLMASLNQDFNVRRLERYLALAYESGAVPVIVLTKADLAGDNTEQRRAAENLAPGVPVYEVSAKTGYGLDNLAQYLKPGKTVVFLGSSGVGKSSLLNALAGEALMDTKEIREDDAKGRHTTTHRQLIMLSSGAMVIDTPGMRVLGMWDADSGLGDVFGDIESLVNSCRFSDCRHESEPGCAVKTAIESGALAESRWNNYVKLKKEAKYADNTAAAIQKKREWHKTIAKMIKQNRNRRD